MSHPSSSTLATARPPAPAPRPSDRADHRRTRTYKVYGEPSPFTYDAIPDELRQLPQWVVWEIQPNGKKMPFTPRIDPLAHVHTLASSTDPTTWGSFADALHTLATGLQQRSKKGNLYRKYITGIGIMFAADDPFAGLDFDKCVTNETVAPGVLATVAHTYAEFSQSGRGVKAIGYGTIGGGMKTDTVEIYSEARLFALTGRVVPGTAGVLADVQSQIDTLVKLYRPNGLRQRSTSKSGTASSEGGDLNWAYVRWLERNLPRLYRSDDTPHVAYLNCPASQQLAQLLTDGTIPPALAAKGDSDSERRSCLAFTTQKLHMLPEERYVLIKRETERHGWGITKRERDLEADYLRLIFDTFPVAPDSIAHVSRSRFAAFSNAPQPAEPQPASVAPVERRPAHRPPGEKVRQIERTHRLIDTMSNIDGVVQDITTAELADEFKKHYPNQHAISRSSMRDYLRAGRDAGLWVAEQENGNGRLVITLKKRVICHPKPTENASAGVTDAMPVLPIATRQTEETAFNVIKEEGENTFFVSPGPVVAQQRGDTDDEQGRISADHRADLRLSRCGQDAPGDGAADGRIGARDREDGEGPSAPGQGIQDSRWDTGIASCPRSRPECAVSTSQNAEGQTEAIAAHNEKNVSLPLPASALPTGGAPRSPADAAPAPSPAAVAVAVAWLATLHPLRIAHMLSLADDAALLSDLEERTPDDYDRAAVVVAVRQWQAAPPAAENAAPAAELLGAASPVAAPTRDAVGVQGFGDPVRRLAASGQNPTPSAPPRILPRRQFRDASILIDDPMLSAILDGTAPEVQYVA